MTLERITSHLREVYVGRITREHMHSRTNKAERLWPSHVFERKPAEACARMWSSSNGYTMPARSEVPELEEARVRGGNRYSLR